jgi:hypothetical protein
VKLPIGPRIDNVTVPASRGSQARAGLRTRPMLGGDGAVLCGDTGKTKYTPVLSWRSRDLADRWSEAVAALVRAAHPDYLGALP